MITDFVNVNTVKQINYILQNTFNPTPYSSPEQEITLLGFGSLGIKLAQAHCFDREAIHQTMHYMPCLSGATACEK